MRVRAGVFRSRSSSFDGIFGVGIAIFIHAQGVFVMRSRLFNSMRSLLSLGLGCLAAASATSSRADCASVIAAYEKAEASGRYALYDAPTMQSAPKGTPFYVRIGGCGYIDSGKGLEKNNAGGAAFEASTLKRQEQKGEERCEVIGEGKVGADVATGWRIRSNDQGSAADPMAIHFWIAKSTGMPLFHAIGSNSDGLRWVYGSDVVAPNTIGLSVDHDNR